MVGEIAKALDVPFISVDWEGMTSFDLGGHLDGRGAEKFTREVLKQLEQTEVFQRLQKEKEILTSTTAVDTPYQ